MKKPAIALFVLLMAFTTFSHGEKAAVLKELMKPTLIAVDSDQLYVTESTTIHIYSLKDYSFIKKFGKQGEGPGEFMAFSSVLPQKDFLLVNSLGKLSYYTKDGEYIKELKAGSGQANLGFFPLKKGFVGTGITREKGVGYIAIHYYDAELKKQKELFKSELPFQQSGKIKLLKETFAYQTYDDKILIAGKKGFAIDVLDAEGKHLFTISREYERRKFTSEDKKKFLEVLKLQLKGQFEAIKNRLAFPDYFPEILSFFVDEDKIYVATWKWQGEKIEFYVFDIEGKFLARLYIPFAFQNALQPYPSTVKGGKLYQLVENEDELWELHISAVKN